MKNPITTAHTAKAMHAAIACPLLAMSAFAQQLYVGEQSNNTVDIINTQSGAFTAGFVAAGGANYQISGPRGMIFIGGKLLVNNQNANTPFNGEVLEFDGNTGQFLKKLVAKEDANAPWNCRGILLGPDNLVYVADLGNFDGADGGLPGEFPGQIRRFGLDGTFRGSVNASNCPVTFNPRGLVVGPDGFLYVTAVGNLALGDSRSGYIVRFSYNSQTANFDYHDLFVENDFANFFPSQLHAPEGLAFGPDGNLYVTSFATFNAFTGGLEDDNQVLVFNSLGNKINSINLDDFQISSAQALLFGPEGDLFVPITSSQAICRYTASSGYSQYDVVPNSASLVNPWYLTFKTTDPTTLNYLPVTAPTLKIGLNRGNAVNLIWNAQAGLAYQLQYKSDLNSTNWTNLGAGISATSTNIATADLINDSRRFYRVVLTP